MKGGGYSRSKLGIDLQAGLTVALLSTPQGIAYALIAGLPPAMGLYAATVPAVVGSLFRSSRHVITGPTNALSLLIGSIIAAQAPIADPVVVATTLAVVTGLIQLVAGILKLGAVVDFISGPVVLGYVTGAGTLIAVGQLPNVTGSPGGRGSIADQLTAWLDGVGHVHAWSLSVAIATIIFVLALRRVDARIPGAFCAMALGVLASGVLDLAQTGVRTVAVIAPVPSGWLPLTLPDWGAIPDLMGVAVIAAVLSLIESCSVARALAARSGQQLDTDAEFRGQGLANLLGGFCGSFVTSGSLTRSELNFRLGAASRMSGVFSGLAVITVLLLLAPLVNFTPVPVLAGLLVVIAMDLVDLKRIRRALHASRGDALAFAATLLATWTLPLEEAVVLGVLVSLVLFLRQVRLLRITEFIVDECGGFREIDLNEPAVARLGSIRVLNLEGPLFFGAAGELQRILDDLVRDGAKAIVVRVKRTRGLDATVAEVFRGVAERLHKLDGHLVLAGLRPDALSSLTRTGAADVIGRQKLLTPRHDMFAALMEGIHIAATSLAKNENHCEGKIMLARLATAESRLM